MAVNFGGTSTYFGGNNSYMSDIYGLAGTYKQVGKSGSYKNFINSYLKDQKKLGNYSDALESLKSSTTNSEAKKFSNVKSSTDNLYASKKTLSDAFKTTAAKKTDSETGVVSYEKTYDMEKITDAVKSFVSDYNKVVDSVNKSGSETLVSKANVMASRSNQAANKLAEIGITVGTDAKLTVDEDKLKNADTDKVKELFVGSSSYADKVMKDALQVGQTASYAATLSGLSYTMDWYV